MLVVPYKSSAWCLTASQRKIRSGCISILQSNVSHKWIKICLKYVHSQMLKGADRKTPPFTVGLERFQWYHNNIDQKQIKVSQNEGKPSPFVETRIRWSTIPWILKVVSSKNSPVFFIGKKKHLRKLGRNQRQVRDLSFWEVSMVFLLDHVGDNQWNFLIFFLVVLVLGFLLRIFFVSDIWVPRTNHLDPKPGEWIGCSTPKRSQGSVFHLPKGVWKT